MAKNNFRRKFIWFIGYHISLRETKAGTQGRKPEGDTEAEKMEEYSNYV